MQSKPAEFMNVSTKNNIYLNCHRDVSISAKAYVQWPLQIQDTLSKVGWQCKELEGNLG